MAYRLLEGESTEESVRRIAREQIGKASDDLAGAGEDLHRAVHEFRKRCKKIRGLIRLVRPAFPGYAGENAWFRDRAAELSGLRDATSMQESLAGLVERYEDDLSDEAFSDVRDWLEERRAAMTDKEDLLPALAAIGEELPAAAERVSGWRLEAAGPEAVEAGLGKTCKRARKAMHAAAAEPTAAGFHEWRKRVKYHRYHTRLIAPAWPRVLKAVHAEAKLLSDVLGDDHDLAVLRDTLTEEAPEALRHAALIALIDRRSEELRAWALSLGRRLYAEEPAAHAARLRASVEAWHDDREAGTLLAPPARRLYT